MRSPPPERWDDGRLFVNPRFAPDLERAGWTTFDAIAQAPGTTAKNLRSDRTTDRCELPRGEQTPLPVYLKRFGRAPLKDLVVPLLRLSWPIWGAAAEWRAIHQFRAAGLPTMTPIALGRQRGSSLLLTEGIEGCEKLSARWATGQMENRQRPVRGEDRQILLQLADIISRMHRFGMHHQDCYLGHVLRGLAAPHRLWIIDLGRLRRPWRLGRRWIVKDLAQLCYSAEGASLLTRLRFFRAYLGRPLQPHDRRLMRRIARKVGRIARHSRRHSL